MAKTKKIHLTQDELKTLFDYRDGALYWRNYRSGINKGAEAGGVNGSTGYRIIGIGDKRYRAHRLIFKMFHNKEPECLDHIDQDRLNNRIENLRAITYAQNLHNRGNPKNNTSGVKGVCWDKRSNRWDARIMVGCIRIKLGYKEDFSEACQLRKEAEIKYYPEIYRDQP